MFEQTYPGKEDYERHFHSLLKAFKDSRYITVDGKPVFVVYKPHNLPNPREFTDTWRSLAEKSGLKGLHLIGMSYEAQWNPQEHGFDGYILQVPRFEISFLDRITQKLFSYRWRLLLAKILSRPALYPYKSVIDDVMPTVKNSSGYYPTVIPNWDNTPRYEKDGYVYTNSTPELFRQQMQRAVKIVEDRELDQRLIFLKSWNEWAEGNHFEPDQRYGTQYLEVVKEELINE